MAVDMSQLLDLYGAAEIRDWVKANFASKDDVESTMASKLKITFSTDFNGQQYTITGGANESYTGTVPASLIVEQTVKTQDTTYTVTCASLSTGTPYDCEIVVGNFYGIYSGEVRSFLSHINCSADISAEGATVKAVCGANTYTRTIYRGTCSLAVGVAGTYRVTATLNGKATSPVTVDVTTENETYNCNLPSPSIAVFPWATGTDEEIAAMVAALDAGTLSVEGTTWAVGDERTVSLSAMEATGVDESHAVQDVTLVLMDSQHYDLVNGGKDHFVVGLKHSLNETGYMNRTNSSDGSWEGSARRAWCNDVFRAAIPETLRGCFKKFKTITAETFSGSTTKISNDYFALFAEQEIFGTRTYSSTAEADALTQIEWYKTATNRKKNCSGSAFTWWERSPDYNYFGYFCNVGSDGDAGRIVTSYRAGLAPFGCI